MCQASPSKSRMAYLMGPSMRERAAHAANSAILSKFLLQVVVEYPFEPKPRHN